APRSHLLLVLLIAPGTRGASSARSARSNQRRSGRSESGSQLEHCRRDLALFNLAIDSKLRGCDLVRLRVKDVCVGPQIRDRTTVIQQKTGRPVQFEITEQTRAAIRDWIASAQPGTEQHLFPSRLHDQPHISTRQYARIVHRWVERAGLDSSAYSTHSMRRTKA